MSVRLSMFLVNKGRLSNNQFITTGHRTFKKNDFIFLDF